MTPGPTPAELVQQYHNYAFTCDCSDNCTCIGCAKSHQAILDLEQDNMRLRSVIDEIQTEVNHKADTFEAKALKSDKTVTFYTGLKSLKQFNDLHKYLESKCASMKYWKGKKHAEEKGDAALHNRYKKLSHKQEFLLTLMKLKRDLKMRFLADLFDVSQTTVTRTFNTWIKFLSRELKPLIFWPDRKLIKRYMPKSLKRCKKLVCTIDCSETLVEKPRDRETYCLSFSDYKRHTTVKYLVAIAPNGFISYVSPVWSGKASDRKITLSDGFVDNLVAGDLVLADQGFTINDVLVQKQVSLDIPPASSGVTQMTKQNVMKTKRIASKRIHVERAIGRLKRFKILKQILPVNFLPLIDDIVICLFSIVQLATAARNLVSMMIHCSLGRSKHFRC